MPLISMVVAATENDVIGRDNGMPWHLPDDLKYFKSRTMGKPMLMGRKTFESIGRPLPNRRNIVITRQPGYAPEGVEAAGSLEAAVALAMADSPEREAFVIGGGEIFRQALPIADRIYLTRVEADVEGDAFFPDLDPREWREVSRREGIVDEKNSLPHAFLVLERRSHGIIKA